MTDSPSEYSTGSSLRLVHITTVPMSLNFFRGQIGYLKAHGFAVEAISSPGEQLTEFAVDQDIRSHTVDMARKISPRQDIISLWRLWRLLKRLKPSIVHSHTPKAGLLGTVAARLAGTPAVFLSIFGLPQMTQNGLRRRMLDFVTRTACRFADRVWCDSFSMRDYVVEQGLCPAHKVVVLGSGSVNGVDAEGRFSPLIHGTQARNEVRDRYGIPRDALVLGFVGRIVGDKGMHELAEAWRSLRNRHQNLHLLLVGPLEDKDPLTAEDQDLFAIDNRVHLVGPQREVPQHFAAMDIFVMPSYREGFGMTNIEAAAMAVPVVSTRIPGCVDSVADGEGGTLVPARDAVNLERAIESYIEDAHLRRRHGEAGRERVLRDFRPETIWAALHEEYARLLAVKGVIRQPSPLPDQR